MAKQNFYDFISIIGEEMEALLIKLRSLISCKKITDNLPDDFNTEINIINNKIENINKMVDIDFFDGGTYKSENESSIDT